MHETFAALALSALIPAVAAAAPAPDGAQRTCQLYDGSTVTLGPDGIGQRTDKAGRQRPVAVHVRQPSSALDAEGADDLAIVREMSVPRRPVAASRVSDGIISLMHACGYGGPCSAQSVVTIISGGTSASAPMVAVVLQVARLTGRTLSPRQVRDHLIATARSVAQAPQSERQRRSTSPGLTRQGPLWVRT